MPMGTSSANYLQMGMTVLLSSSFIIKVRIPAGTLMTISGAPKVLTLNERSPYPVRGMRYKRAQQLFDSIRIKSPGLMLKSIL